MKRWISILLTAALLTVLLPAGVLAAEGDAATDADGNSYATISLAVSNVRDGGSITLLKSVEESVEINCPGVSFTLDLNGQALTGAAGGTALTLTDGSVLLTGAAGSAVIGGNGGSPSAAPGGNGILVQGGSLTVSGENVSVTGGRGGSGQNGGTGLLVSGGSVSLQGGMFQGGQGDAAGPAISGSAPVNSLLAPAWRFRFIQEPQLPVDDTGNSIAAPVRAAAIPAGFVPETGWYQAGAAEFTVSTPAQLAGLAQLVNAGTDSFAGKSVFLDGDINLSGWDWVPIGTAANPFLGVFDGRSHTVNFMTVAGYGKQYQGLFGCACDMGGGTGGVIRNVMVGSASAVAGSGETGAIAGAAWELDNCRNYGRVLISGGGSCGGVAGTAFGAVKNCVNTGTVGGEGTAIGGVVGTFRGSALKNSYHTGLLEITVGSPAAGGIAGGLETGRVENCYSRGTVSGTVQAAGLVGVLQSGTELSHSYWKKGEAVSAGVGSNLGGTLTSLGSFTDYTGALSDADGTALDSAYGNNILLNTLAGWIGAQSDKSAYHPWYWGEDDYPSFEEKRAFPVTTTTKVTNNEDGSVTTATTYLLTGIVDEITVYPNGAQVSAKLMPDGRVTAQATVPEEEGSCIVSFLAGEWNNVAVIAGTGEGEEHALGCSYRKGDRIYARVRGQVTLKGEERGGYFDDTQGHWAEASAEFTAMRELFQGTAPRTFSPQKTMNRAMLVTVLYRLEGMPEIAPSGEFKDVKANSYYAKAVAWAVKNGIAEGVTADTFAPGRAVTREELAAFLCRYARLIDAKLPGAGVLLEDFADAGSVSSYAREGMAWSVNMGVLTGKEDGRLYPKEPVDRAEVAAVFQRFIEGLLGV